MTTIKIISIILAALTFLIILYIGFKTDVLREKVSQCEKVGPYSFGRFQLWLWTLIICPVFTLYWGFSPGQLIDLNTTSLILLGIPSAVTVASDVISSSQEAAMRKDTPIPESCVPSDAPLPLKKYQLPIAFWTDLISDDNGQLSLGRLQHLIFTSIFAFVFVTTFFSAKLETLPTFGSEVFVLMGISSGTYLLGKGLYK